MAAAADRRRGPEPALVHEFGSLAAHLRFVERSSRKLARSTFYAMTRWQAELEHKQAVLGRIVDIGAELFAIASASSTPTRSRASIQTGAGAPTISPTCSPARPAAASTRCSRRCGTTTTPPATQTAQKLLDGRYTWLEEGVLGSSGEPDARP